MTIGTEGHTKYEYDFAIKQSKEKCSTCGRPFTYSIRTGGSVLRSGYNEHKCAGCEGGYY